MFSKGDSKILKCRFWRILKHGFIAISALDLHRYIICKHNQYMIIYIYIHTNIHRERESNVHNYNVCAILFIQNKRVSNVMPWREMNIHVELVQDCAKYICLFSCVFVCFIFSILCTRRFVLYYVRVLSCTI